MRWPRVGQPGPRKTVRRCTGLRDGRAGAGAGPAAPRGGGALIWYSLPATALQSNAPRTGEPGRLFSAGAGPRRQGPRRAAYCRHVADRAGRAYPRSSGGSWPHPGDDDRALHPRGHAPDEGRERAHGLGAAAMHQVRRAALASVHRRRIHRPRRGSGNPGCCAAFLLSAWLP